MEPKVLVFERSRPPMDEVERDQASIRPQAQKLLPKPLRDFSAGAEVRGIGCLQTVRSMRTCSATSGQWNQRIRLVEERNLA